MLFGSGTLLILSGLFHIAVWLVLGGDWEGPVSWRKPILFGISTGATVISAGWIYPKLKPLTYDTIACGLFGFAMVAEVGLITLQQWRGTASHFNHGTATDDFIERWMTYLIAFATLFLIELTRRCFVHLNAPRDQRLAILGGMIFLLISCLIGFLIHRHGQLQAASGLDPSLFGQAGVTKFPHGVAIHTIQLLPYSGWLFAKLGITLKERARLIAYLIVSTSAFLVFSIAQTLAGKARFDVTTVGAVFLTASVLALSRIAWSVLRAVRFPKK